ncbi:MAG: 6-phosphogluconolactonase [Thermoleophilia bacterium]
MKPEVIVVPDGLALADEAAERVEALAVASSTEKPATVSLAGGRTPRVAYQHLGSRCVPWARLQLFFGDERLVPPDDEASNYRLAREAFLERMAVPPTAIHRIKGELAPDDAAAAAEAEVREVMGVPPGVIPRLDLCLLGIGPDGHTASLFPDDPVLDVTDRLMVPVHRPEMPEPWRVTMTMPFINASRRVLFLVDGAEKADVVTRAIEGDPSIPAGRVRPTDGELVFLITEATTRG